MSTGKSIRLLSVHHRAQNRKLDSSRKKKKTTHNPQHELKHNKQHYWCCHTKITWWRFFTVDNGKMIRLLTQHQPLFRSPTVNAPDTRRVEKPPKKMQMRLRKSFSFAFFRGWSRPIVSYLKPKRRDIFSPKALLGASDARRNCSSDQFYGINISWLIKTFFLLFWSKRRMLSKRRHPLPSRSKKKKVRGSVQLCDIYARRLTEHI